MNRALLFLVVLLVVAMAACGGGGGSTPVSPPPPPPKAVITVNGNQRLPDAVQGQPYSVTFTASNAQGAVKWSISPYATNWTYVDGLSIDPATGVLSGTPTFWGDAQFYASVTDADSKTAWKVFNINAYGKLSAGAPNNFSYAQYQTIYTGQLNIQGGYPPLHFSLASGSLPQGVKISGYGQLSGTPLQAGTYSAAVLVTDSWSTPQTATQMVDITVNTAGLTLTSNVGGYGSDGNILINRPTNAALFANGGVPPYTYSISFGTPPTGMSLDTSTGKFTGTPTTLGYSSVTAAVHDSLGSSATTFINFYVYSPHGRNDTIQTATAAGNGSYNGSLSPYIDPPSTAPAKADSDYYKIVSMAGTVIKLSMSPQRPIIDPVLEVVDGNGVRLSTCNTPDISSTNYTSPCVNDDDSSGSHSASFDYKVPGATAAIVTSYIHASDWYGNARPDMQYYMTVSGNVEPLYLQLGATRNVAYSYSPYLPYTAIQPSTWTLDNGALPDGLSLSTTGVISGTATTDGSYSFRLKAVDSSPNPQTFYVFVTFTVGEPVHITSAAIWPNACVGKPYSFTATSSGGVPPVQWGFFSNFWVPINLNSSTGVFSGTSFNAGTFTGRVYANDLAGSGEWQDISLTVQNCP